MNKGIILKKTYDDNDINSILNHSKLLIGKTFLSVINESELTIERKQYFINKYSNLSNKGGLGLLLEEVHFGYKPNNEQSADFSNVGIELKSSPYEIKKDKTLRAGERLSVTMIPHNRPIEEEFFKSDVWHKIQSLLLIYYLRDQKEKNRLNYQIDFAYLFRIPDEDLKIIIDDFKKITTKVTSGELHELSESDTLYLGACTKGASAKKSIFPQYYGNHVPAKARNFCLKQSYMSFVLNNYIKNNINNYEQILSNVEDISNKAFEDYIVDKINKYVGKSDFELCALFNREYNNNKAQWIDLAYRMLGIKSNKAAEFEKANIVVKAIRIEENGKIRENMSFPVFKYKDIAKETWEESQLFKYFEETKFLFIIFKKCSDRYILKGSQFWNMSQNKLNNDVKKGWIQVVDTIKKGVIWEIKNDKSVCNNLLKKKQNSIIHVRPHAQKSYHEFLDGTVIGNGKRSDANQLPDGRWMTNYCFWVNKEHILSELKKELKT